MCILKGNGEKCNGQFTVCAFHAEVVLGLLEGQRKAWKYVFSVILDTQK